MSLGLQLASRLCMEKQERPARSDARCNASKGSNARQVYRCFDRLNRSFVRLRLTMSETILRRIWQTIKRWRYQALALALLFGFALLGWSSDSSPDRTAGQS